MWIQFWINFCHSTGQAQILNTHSDRRYLRLNLQTPICAFAHRVLYIINCANPAQWGRNHPQTDILYIPFSNCCSPCRASKCLFSLSGSKCCLTNHRTRIISTASITSCSFFFNFKATYTTLRNRDCSITKIRDLFFTNLNHCVISDTQ